jgi:hypothetical protein
MVKQKGYIKVVVPWEGLPFTEKMEKILLKPKVV